MRSFNYNLSYYLINRTNAQVEKIMQRTWKNSSKSLLSEIPLLEKLHLFTDMCTTVTKGITKEQLEVLAIVWYHVDCYIQYCFKLIFLHICLLFLWATPGFGKHNNLTSYLFRWRQDRERGNCIVFSLK